VPPEMRLDLMSPEMRLDLMSQGMRLDFLMSKKEMRLDFVLEPQDEQGWDLVLGVTGDAVGTEVGGATGAGPPVYG
jgi:hypothetical protein